MKFLSNKFSPALVGDVVLVLSRTFSSESPLSELNDLCHFLETRLPDTREVVRMTPELATGILVEVIRGTTWPLEASLFNTQAAAKHLVAEGEYPNSQDAAIPGLPSMWTIRKLRAHQTSPADTRKPIAAFNPRAKRTFQLRALIAAAASGAPIDRTTFSPNQPYMRSVALQLLGAITASSINELLPRARERERRYLDRHARPAPRRDTRAEGQFRPFTREEMLPSADQRAFLSRFPPQVVEELFQLAITADEFLHVAIANRKAMRLLRSFEPGEETRVALEHQLTDSQRLARLFSLYAPIEAQYRSLQRSYYGRTLLNEIDSSLIFFFRHWPYLLGNPSLVMNLALAETLDAQIEALTVIKADRFTSRDFGHFSAVANGEQDASSNDYIRPKGALNRDADLWEFRAVLVKTFGLEMASDRELLGNIDFNLTASMGYTAEPSGVVHHHAAVSKALLSGATLWEATAPAWLKPSYDKFERSSPLVFEDYSGLRNQS